MSRFQPSRRSSVAPFIAMEVLAAAVERERAGHRVIHMEVGQPGANAPSPVIAAAKRALDGRLGYTEALGIRSVLAYALGGAVVGLCAYLSLVPFDSDAMRFATIDHRQLEVMTGAGILAGLVYWIIAGRSAGADRNR